MQEAGCLEWALILAIMLRDNSAVIRVVNTASQTETPLDMVARMREGLSYLELWADTEWYVLFEGSHIFFTNCGALKVAKF